jgi:hypothetical protein
MSLFTTVGDLGARLSDLNVVMWHEGFDSVPMAARSIVSVRNTSTKTSDHDSWDFDVPATTTGEGSNYAISAPVKGDALVLTQAKITQGVELTKESQMYDRYNQTDNFAKMRGLGKACPTRIERDLQHFFMSFGFGTSYTNRDGASVATTGADALAIYSNDHTVNGGSTTYDNLHSTAFGQTGLEAAEDLFRAMINHDEELVEVIPDTIVTTSKANVVNLVREYNKGMNHIEDAARGINVYQGRYDHVVFEYGDTDAQGARDSSKDDYWLLVSRANNHHGILEISQEPRVFFAGKDRRNQNDLWLTDAHFAYGMLGAQWIVGSNA